MAWQDRLRKASYTTPGGTRFDNFVYEDVSKTTSKKTREFDFADVDGVYVQDLGNRGRRLPLNVIFWGENHDLEADSFEQGLLEVGVGKLEHPIYGVIDVVPFGEISRSDRLVTAANQSQISVTFYETTGFIYPTSQTDPASTVSQKIKNLNNVAPQQFARSVDLTTTEAIVVFENNYRALFDKATTALKPIADSQADIRQRFEAIRDSISVGIDTLVEDPVTLASQTALLIQAPARSVAEIGSRLETYKDLLSGILGGDAPEESGANEFYLKDNYATNYVAGSVISAINTQFLTKNDAIAAVDEILSQFDDQIAWRDDGFAAVGGIDTGESYQALNEAVSAAAGFLVQISFTLRREKRIVLTRPRSIIDLVAELYGTVDDELDFFISSNNLTGSEIIELPRNREIVYYV